MTAPVGPAPRHLRKEGEVRIECALSIRRCRNRPSRGQLYCWRHQIESERRDRLLIKAGRFVAKHGRMPTFAEVATL